MMRMSGILGVMVCALLMSLPVMGQDIPVTEGVNEAAANATNPLAFVTKLQVQPNFTWMDNNGRQLNLTSRIIQPSKSIGLPFFKSKDPSKVYTLYRLEVPIIGQTLPENNAVNATGLGDLILLDVIAFKQKWGLLGAGPGLIIPVMKPEPISSRKWAAGATVVALNTMTKGLQWGALAQQFFSFGGDDNRPAQSFMLFQPIFNKMLGGGKFIQFNPIMNFNWTNSTFNIPLGISYGKAFAKNLSVSVGGEYTVSGPGQGDFTFRFNLNTMFPAS
jgi:hypothetical protein